MGHFRPWCRIDADGSLSLDSFHARRMLVTADSGQEPSVAARSWPDSEAGQAFLAPPATIHLCAGKVRASSVDCGRPVIARHTGQG